MAAFLFCCSGCAQRVTWVGGALEMHLGKRDEALTRDFDSMNSIF